MNQQYDSDSASSSTDRQSQHQQEQSQSGAPRPDPNGGMHPGNDRDDYGAPASDSGRVGQTQYEQGEDGGEWDRQDGDRRDLPGQQEQADPARRDRLNEDDDRLSNEDGPLDE